MTWTILLIGLSVLCIYLAVSRRDDSDAGAIGRFGIFIALVLVAIIQYPLRMDSILESEKEEIIVLRKGVDEVRASIYENSKAGLADVTNANQSKALSDYTIDVLKKEAAFNSKLASYKFALKSSKSFWFGFRIYLSSSIEDIKPFKSPEK